MSSRSRITHERLCSLLRYDAQTGLLTWIAKSSKHSPAQIGDIAGSLEPDGYLRVTIDRVVYSAHVLIWFYVTGGWPKEEVDHRDLDRSNNRWLNLREATRAQNMANMRHGHSNTTGLKGIYLQKPSGKYLAQIRINHKKTHIGRFDCPAAAHFAYIVAADKQFGKFARVS